MSIRRDGPVTRNKCAARWVWRVLGLVAALLGWHDSAEAAISTRLHLAPERGIANRFMVVVDPAAVQQGAPRESKRSIASVAAQLAGRHRGRVTRLWENAVTGFVVELQPQDAARLAEEPWVIGVYQDATLSVPINDCSEGAQADGVQSMPTSPQSIECADPNPQNATGVCTDNWGLDRIDQPSTSRDGLYHFDAIGSGVHIYFIDTGLYAGHQEFTGRVGAGYNTAIESTNTSDCANWSHGTHVAGIAAGKTYGIAKGATLHSLKIWDCNTIERSNIVQAFEWIYSHHNPATQGPAVVNISMNNSANYDPDWTGTTSPLGMAVANLINNRGILVIESAGNQAGEACAHSFGVPGVLVVGGVDEYDTRWERDPSDPNYSDWCQSSGDCGSNYGSCVDIWAPAAHIVSSWSGASRNYCRLSGTSMAAPVATGVAALYLQTHPTATPAEVTTFLTSGAVKGVLTELGAGSPDGLISTQVASPGISVLPVATLSFGTTGVGVATSPQTITITSAGDAALQLGTIVLAGSHPGDFAIVANPCSNASLAPGATCQLSLRFTPTTTGARTAEVRLPSNDTAAGTVVITLTGQGVEPRLTVTLAGAGTGGVSSNPAGILCGNTCSAQFPGVDSVVLTAIPSSNSRFVGWSPSGLGASNTATIVLASDQQVTATFVLIDDADGAHGGDADAAGDADLTADGLAAASDERSHPPSLEPPLEGTEVVGGCDCRTHAGSGLTWLVLGASIALWQRRRSRSY